MAGQRRHRRATSEPTKRPPTDASPTPDADWTGWFTRPETDAAMPAASAGQASSSETDGQPPRTVRASNVPQDETDRWYLEQRPPHWG